MSKRVLNIWGRELQLEILYDCYAGEEILDIQREAFTSFCEKATVLLKNAEEKVKEYCLRMNGDEIGSSCIENLFKYVKPKSIFIKRTTNGDRVVALLCAYRFNPDDGMAIVFTNENFTTVGTENIVL